MFISQFLSQIFISMSPHHLIVRSLCNNVLFHVLDGIDTTYVRFLASNAEAGSIIGKGGMTISDFQSRTNARIQLSRNFEYFPGTSDRVIMVSGTIDEVLEAVELILTKLFNEVILLTPSASASLCQYQDLQNVVYA